MPNNKDLNYFVGAVIKGEYKKRGFTLESLAEGAAIPYSSLRKKIAGDAPLLVTELNRLVKTLGISAQTVLIEAEDLLDARVAKSGLSVASDTTDELSTKRKQNEARAMTVEQIETMDERAATTDPEMDSDESD